jgi:hypothetical protein
LGRPAAILMRSLSALRLPARFFRLPFVSAVQADRGRMLLLVAPAQIVQHFQKVVQYLAAFRLGAVGSQKQYAQHLAGYTRDRRLALLPTRHCLVSYAQLYAEAGTPQMPDSRLAATAAMYWSGWWTRFQP